MSHVTCAKSIVTDLDVLEKAVEGFPQLEFVKNKKTFNWYGRWMNDYDAADAAYKLGIDISQYGKCDHAIKLKGCQYEIGVVRRKDGQGWSLVWDFYGDGIKISEYIGKSAEILMSAYQEEAARQFAEQNGYMVQYGLDENGEEVIELVPYS